MVKAAKILSARGVEAIKEPGRHADGGGLYFVVAPSGSRSWVFRFKYGGKVKDMGLGGYPAVALAKARELADDARAHVKAGRNPIEVRKVEPAKVPTFGEAADAYVDAMAPQFRSAKHIAQWRMTLTEYAAPIRGKLVSEVTTDDVLKVLKVLWTEKPETASRVRGRIERVLNAAKAQGHRSGENPAAWRGHLANLLPKRHKLTRGHHAAMPFADVPAFLVRLRDRDATAARALEFAILTAARSGEVREATWSEFDLDAAVWTVPAPRMKAGREHRVPLSPRAVAILKEMTGHGQAPGAYVFPGTKKGRPLSVMAMDMVLRRMDLDVTVHGFRSSFRDWAGEASTFPREVAEAALAHVVGDQTERAYRRGDALAKRRKLMEAWGGFCEPKTGGQVVALRRRRDT